MAEISSDSLHQGARCHPQPHQPIRGEIGRGSDQWEAAITTVSSRPIWPTSDLDGMMADCYCRQSLNAERQLIGFDQMESGLKPRLFNLLIAGFGAIRSKGTVGSDSILQFEKTNLTIQSRNVYLNFKSARF